MPGGARRQLPEFGVTARRSVETFFPGDIMRSAFARRIRNGDAIADEGSKNQRRAGSVSLSSSNSRRTARSFLRSSMPRRIVSSHSTSP